MRVNDVLEMNAEALARMYKKGVEADPADKSKFLGRARLEKWFIDNDIIDCSRKKVGIAFGLSKMTCPDENEAGPEEYEHIRLVEFMDMIGRVAQLIYIGTPMDKQWPLATKVFMVCDGILKKYTGINAKSPDEDDGTETESDREY